MDPVLVFLLSIVIGILCGIGLVLVGINETLAKIADNTDKK